MPKVVSLKPETNPDAEDAHKQILEFAETAKEHGVTSVLMIGITPTQHAVSNYAIAPGEHLRLLGLSRVMVLQLEASILEELES